MNNPQFDDERRNTTRIRRRATCRFRVVRADGGEVPGATYDAETQDLSPAGAGLIVRGFPDLAVGPLLDGRHLLRLAFDLGPDDGAVEADARLCWIMQGLEGEHRIGVEFVRLPAEARDRIRASLRRPGEWRRKLELYDTDIRRRTKRRRRLATVLTLVTALAAAGAAVAAWGIRANASLSSLIPGQ